MIPGASVENMEIREIQDKKIWEDFLLECEEKTFLQSWDWGEFQKKDQNKIWRFGIFENDDLVGVTLVVKFSAKRGCFFLIPHGPVIRDKTPNIKREALKILRNKLKDIAKEEGVDFIRFSPIWEKTDENIKIFSSLRFKPAPLHSHPEASWKLNILPSENELLLQMRKTTRYLLKQGQKNEDIEIIKSNNIDDVELFNKLHLEVVKVQKFIPFSLDYFKKEFESFNNDGQILILFAKYKGEFAAASYVIFWSNMAFYHHAALLPRYHKIPLAYLLQWSAIKEAKNRGCVLYDFWGYVNPKTHPKHSWAGPTLFKMGFGGEKYEYVKTQDFVISLKYWLNYAIEILRKIKRGL